MKKGLCIVLSALMIVFSFVACGKKIDKETPTKVDENGSAYIEVTDKDGNEVTSVLSDKDKAKADKNAAKTTTTAGAIDTSKLEKEYSAIGNLSEEDLKSDKKDLIPDGTSIKKTSLRDDIIAKTIKSGKFTIKMTLQTASDGTMPVTLVSNGKKLAADMTIEGATIRAIFEDGKAYVVMPNAKMYFQMSSDDLGNIGDIGSMVDSDGTYVSSSKVKKNGVEYTCEEYKSADGTIIKYYFAKNEWKRMEVITDEEVAIYEIETLSSKADESIFSLKGYSDMTALLGQADLTTTTKKK